MRALPSISVLGSLLALTACIESPDDGFAFSVGSTAPTGVTGGGTDAGTTSDTGESTGGGSTGGGSSDGDGTGAASAGDGGSTSGAGTTGAGSTTSGTGGSGTTGAGTSTTGGTTSTTGGVMGFACQNDNPRPTITCGGQEQGSFIGKYGDVEDICGDPFKYQDQIFEFTPAQDVQATVTFAANPDPGDGAIFVMEGVCNAGACIDKSTGQGNYHELSFSATAGVTYYIDLELPSQQPTFTLTLACS